MLAAIQDWFWLVWAVGTLLTIGIQAWYYFHTITMERRKCVDRIRRLERALLQYQARLKKLEQNERKKQ